MSLIAAAWIVRLLEGYLAIGLLFAVPFALVGAGRLDEVARRGTPGFRLLIIPGAAALWPLLGWRWLSGRTAPPRERNAHRDTATETPQ